MAAPADGTDLEASLLSFEKLDRASPDLWPEQLPGVAEFAASFKSVSERFLRLPPSRVVVVDLLFPRGGFTSLFCKVRLDDPFSPITSSPPKWMAELENDDIDMLKVTSLTDPALPTYRGCLPWFEKWHEALGGHQVMALELGSLTTANLMEKVRGLQNLAYQLGLDEYETE
ncbi:protein lin-52 homolog isoform 2-T2 [Rhynochetos jubatus]